MDFAPTELGFIADPYPAYAELREREPVHYDKATDHWLVSRYEAGIHFCLGAPLGRQELQVSFTTLMDRFPNLELVEEPRWKPNFIIRGLDGLRVRP